MKKKKENNSKDFFVAQRPLFSCPWQMQL